MKPAIRLAIAWLAAWCQVIVVAAMPLGTLAASLDPLGGTPICHADTDDGQTPPSQPAHDDHRCMMCLACQSDRGTVALLATPPALPDRSVVGFARFVVAQPRAPPLLPIIAARPRGPPSLI